MALQEMVWLARGGSSAWLLGRARRRLARAGVPPRAAGTGGALGERADAAILARLCAVAQVDVHIVLGLVELAAEDLACFELDGDGVTLGVVQHLDRDANVLRHADE